MSEFKYACPVCGQHIKCDSSQAGSKMECPTCFQKIIVPQAPAEGDQKFIITGTKVGERPAVNVPTDRVVAAEKNFPVAVVVILLILTCAVGAAIYFFGGKRVAEKPPPPPPAPVWASSSLWQSGDIGEVGAAGSFSKSKGVFTLDGSGADIWHQADGFYYVFQPLTGDGSLTAEILNIKNTDEWAKAGVMIRETTNASSVFVLASLRADGQAQLIWRSATGAEAQSSDLAGGTGYPKWVKVVRRGNDFSGYYKVNAGDEWMPMGTAQTISMSPNAQIGLIVCAHNAGTLCQAQFDQLALQTENKPKPAAPTVPKPVAPPATDTNWMLNLDAAIIPDATAAGRIHGEDFIIERAVLLNGTLILREGTRGTVEFGVTINFEGALPETLSGKTINVTTNAEKAAKVSLRWKDANGTVQKKNYDDNYALRLEFGALANNRLPGKIYLCTPDAEKSYLMGTFNADARKPKPKAPRK